MRRSEVRPGAVPGGLGPLPSPLRIQEASSGLTAGICGALPVTLTTSWRRLGTPGLSEHLLPARLTAPGAPSGAGSSTQQQRGGFSQGAART